MIWRLWTDSEKALVPVRVKAGDTVSEAVRHFPGRNTDGLRKQAKKQGVKFTHGSPANKYHYTAPTGTGEFPAWVRFEDVSLKYPGEL